MTHDRETLLRQNLAEIRRRADAEARPIIDELVRLEAMKPPKPMIAYRDVQCTLALRAMVTPLPGEGKSPLDLLQDMAAGISIHKHSADGTVERIPPEDFYAKPEGE